VLVSLHSDGCIAPVLDCIAELGYDFIHPWQENAGMPYSLYLENYADKFGILGGVCIQSALGFGDLPRLRSEIDRVFGLLHGKRWACCTTHFVQNHCSIEELVFAYDHLRQLCDRPR
jgi:uroporphyrinogen decarboxylase